MVAPPPARTPNVSILWAKLERGGGSGYHPLLCHLLDVAAVAGALWNDVLPPGVRSKVADGLEIEAGAAGRWVSCWAGLHDLGKASSAFQGLQTEARRRVKKVGYRWPRPPVSIAVRHGAITAASLPAAVGRSGLPEAVLKRLAAVIGGHHGLIPRSIDVRNAERAIGRDERHGEWAESRRVLAARLLLGAAGAAPPRSLDPTTAIWLAGFVSVADWIGSNTEFFPFAVQDPDHPPADLLAGYERTAADRAARALHRLGWTAWPAPTAPRSFVGLFPKLAPNPMQAAVAALGETTAAPALVVIEAPMGEGKTEAAFTLVDRWGAAGRRGAYVALPTRATSDQMFGRVREFLSSRYPADIADIVSIQLLHGLASLSGEFAELRRNSDRLFAPGEVYADDGEPVAGGIVAAEWFTHRKRGLLAPFGVGTVDQILLAVLQTRHGFVRLFGLAGKTVVVDEVHAYDAYMSTLLERLLEWLAALGSPVVLLSATLPTARRDALLTAYARGLGLPEPTHPSSAGDAPTYPRLSWVGAAGGGRQAVPASGRSRKEVRVVWVPGDDAALARRLQAVLADGGCAGIVCNTVVRAQDLYRALRPFFPDRADDGDAELDLLHARYLFEDREARERRTLRRFGKAEAMVDGAPVRRPRRAVLVATQIIEQSLDLDFDLLVTDPAPADLVLQRIGRLHRHPGRDRHGLGEPEVWIRQPLTEAGVPRFDRGTAAVYDGHVLLRSWLALQDRPAIRVPADVAPLVEAVYDDDRPCPADVSPPVRESWETTRRELVARRERDEAKANAFRILSPRHPSLFEDFNRELAEDDPSIHHSLQALTRLGDRSVSVVCLGPEERAGLLLSEVPDIAGTWALLRRSVALADRRIVGDLEALKVPSGWRRSALLRHHRLLELDAEGGCRVGNHRLEWNNDLGIVVTSAT